jgi:hypothetical protein
LGIVTKAVMEEYNPKKENIPYTICIVKPDIVAKDTAV